MKPVDPDTGQRERFLSRWSRLKREEARPPQAPAVPGAPQASASGAPPAAPAAAAAQSDIATSLPPIESLSIDSDFTPFLQPKVPDALRRAAVKKLFADPRFNVMDGLDVYIDDYSIPDPIPPEMMKLIAHARDLIDHPSDRLAREQAAAAAGAADDVAAPNAGPEADAHPDAPGANRAAGVELEAAGASLATGEQSAEPRADIAAGEQSEAPGANRAAGADPASPQASRR